jgi:hypothetical protein
MSHIRCNCKNPNYNPIGRCLSCGGFHEGDPPMTNNTTPELPVEVAECINNWIVTFALAYHRRKDKDISNDAAEFITDELSMPNVLTSYATKLHLSEQDNTILKDEICNLSQLLLEKDETIKVLTNENTRMKGEMEGYREACEELKKENKHLKDSLQGLVDVLPKGESLHYYFAKIELIHARGILLIYNDKK